MNDISVITKK